MMLFFFSPYFLVAHVKARSSKIGWYWSVMASLQFRLALLSIVAVVAAVTLGEMKSRSNLNSKVLLQYSGKAEVVSLMFRTENGVIITSDDMSQDGRLGSSWVPKYVPFAEISSVDSLPK